MKKDALILVRGGGDLAAVQRVGQILLGHELSASVVDEDHAVFHLGGDPAAGFSVRSRL